VRFRGGVVEFYDGGVKWLLQRFPLAEGAMAFTLGHTVSGQTDAALEISHFHEMVHVRQFERWGPLMGWWLPDLLNVALAANRFRRQFHRKLKIGPWRNRLCYPRELLPWDEGSTQVDLSIQWENPPTTFYIEMKYGSDLSAKTAGSAGQHGFPTDQLIRNARVGLLECGWFRRSPLFDLPPRDFVLVFCGPTKGHRLVARYRDCDQLRKAIPHSHRLRDLPKLPFVGELSYADIVRLLRRQRPRFTLPEQKLIDTLADYLVFKSANRGSYGC
jgi:hypothetical protein